ncbi:hypothetical protein FRC07_010427, partial [Ceratobasidium sp. 392]
LVGATEIVQRAFVDPIDPNDDARPTLLADEVGLGKTGTIIVALQLLWHLLAVQDAIEAATRAASSGAGNEDTTTPPPWPRHLGKKTSFMGKGSIPRHPSIFIIPPTLRIQWTNELKRWLAPEQCTVLAWKGSEQMRKKFMAQGSPYQRAVQGNHPERTIILVQSPTLSSEYGSLSLQAGDRDSGEVAPDFSRKAADMFIGQPSLLGVIDESHDWRNFRTKCRAGLAIMSKASLRVAMTATPVHTHAKDLLSQGRLIRAPEFIGERGTRLTKAVNSLFSTGTRTWTSEHKQDVLKRFLEQKARRARGQVMVRPSETPERPASPTPSSTSTDDLQLVADLVLRYNVENGHDKPQGYKAFWTTKNGMISLRHALRGIIIRRDSRSLDVDGKPLLGLHPKVEILAFCEMDQRMEDALKRQMDTKQAREEAKYDLTGFFTRYKKILAHPLLENVFAKSADDGPTMTIAELIEQEFATWDQYKTHPSSKIDNAIRIIEHHRGADRATVPPLYWTRDGNQVAPEFSPGPDDKGPQIARKFVIYSHLSQSWTLMQHVLGVRGIASVHVNGSMSQLDRDANVQAFMRDDGPEVIVLSDVVTNNQCEIGSWDISTPLIRTAIRTLVIRRTTPAAPPGTSPQFLRQPSTVTPAVTSYVVRCATPRNNAVIYPRTRLALFTRRTSSYARKGQEQRVYVYRLVVPNTPDEFLLGYATGKGLMMQLFTREVELRGEPGFEPEVFEAVVSGATTAQGKP